MPSIVPSIEGDVLVFPNVEGEAYGMMWGVEKGIEEEET